jgi:hypothetical protein
MAYYVGVTGERFTSVSCRGFNSGIASYAPGANKYNNPFTDEVALFKTSEGGSSRMLMCKGIIAHQSALKDGETLAIPQYARPRA